MRRTSDSLDYINCLTCPHSWMIEIFTYRRRWHPIHGMIHLGGN